MAPPLGSTAACLRLPGGENHDGPRGDGVGRGGFDVVLPERRRANDLALRRRRLERRRGARRRRLVWRHAAGYRERVFGRDRGPAGRRAIVRVVELERSAVRALEGITDRQERTHHFTSSPSSL